MDFLNYFKGAVLDYMVLLRKEGFELIDFFEQERDIKIRFAKRKLLVTINYNIPNEFIDLYIKFDFESLNSVKNLYYNSITLMDLFFLNKDLNYDSMMPKNIGILKSLESINFYLEKYAFDIIEGKKLITTREIFYLNRSPYGGQPYSESELKDIALFQLSVKKKD